MSTNPPTPPTPDKEAEYKSFSEMMGRFLAEDDDKSKAPTPPANPTQSAPNPTPDGGSLAGLINSVLDEREHKSKVGATLDQHSKDIEELKKSGGRKKRGWFSPLFD